MVIGSRSPDESVIANHERDPDAFFIRQLFMAGKRCSPHMRPLSEAKMISGKLAGLGQAVDDGPTASSSASSDLY